MALRVGPVPPKGSFDITWYRAPVLAPAHLITAAIDVVKNLGRPLTRAEIERFGGFTLRDRLDSWLPLAVGRGQLVQTVIDGIKHYNLPA